MPRPRRRRRFFALEGRFEVDDTGELQGIIDEDRPAVAPVESGGAPGAEPAAGEAELPPALRLSRASRVQPQPRDQFSLKPMGFGLVGLALGALAGHFLPGWLRKPAAVETVASAPPTAAMLTRADEDDLDAAYAARHARRYDEAERLFTALARRHPGWDPMDIELARTLYYANRSYEASYNLRAAADRGAMPAEANYLLGMLNHGRGGQAGSETNFARAVSLDPTRPEYYFFWGESLRAEGKLLEAITRFRSALLRNQNEAAITLYRTKLWLSEIEADREDQDGVRAEIDAALTQPHPPVDALVAAAARDLKAGHADAAAVRLRRARRSMDSTVFAYLMQDPLFADARGKPEWAELFRATPPEPGPEASPEMGSPASSPLPLNELAPAPAVRPVVPSK